MNALRILALKSILQPRRLVAYYWTARGQGFQDGLATAEFAVKSRENAEMIVAQMRGSHDG